MNSNVIFLLVQLLIATIHTAANIDADANILPRDYLKFRSEVPYGKSIHVHFNFPSQVIVKGTHPYVGLYVDTDDSFPWDELPDEAFLHSYLYSCNSKYTCEHKNKVNRGLVSFGPKNPISEYKGSFPFKPGKYRVCLVKEVHISNDKYSYSLITNCEPIIVKKPKRKIIKKTTITPIGELSAAKDLVVKFISPKPVGNQFIALYAAGTEPSHEDLRWAYTGCNNHEGDQAFGYNCANKKKSGEVQLKGEADHPDLKPGSYIVCLVMEWEYPFEYYKCSKPFDVTE